MSKSAGTLVFFFCSSLLAPVRHTKQIIGTISVSHSVRLCALIIIKIFPKTLEVNYQQAYLNRATQRIRKTCSEIINKFRKGIGPPQQFFFCSSNSPSPSHCSISVVSFSLASLAAAARRRRDASIAYAPRAILLRFAYCVVFFVRYCAIAYFQFTTRIIKYTQKAII